MINDMEKSDLEKTSEDELPFGGKGVYANPSPCEKLAEALGKWKIKEDTGNAKAGIERIVKETRSMSLGKVFALGIRCSTMKELLYLQLALCYFTSYQIISDKSFARFMYVLEPMLKLARSALGTENTEVLDKSLPWDADLMYSWGINILYEDYEAREIYFVMSESCKKCLEAIPIRFSNRFSRIYMTNVIPDDWWRCKHEGRTVYRIIGDALLYRSVDTQNGDLYILNSKGKSKLLAQGIEDFAVDQDKKKVFIHYIKRDRRFGCYDLRTENMKQTSEYLEEKIISPNVWTERLARELVSPESVDVWENYVRIEECVLPLIDYDPLQCVRKRMMVDLYYHISDGIPFSKIMARIKLLEKSGMTYRKEEALLLKKTIQVFENQGFDADTRAEKLLKSLYQWINMVLPASENGSLMNEKFVMDLKTTFDKEPLRMYMALRNADMEYLKKVDFLQDKDKPSDAKENLPPTDIVDEKYVGRFDYDEKTGHIRISKRSLALADLEGRYSVRKDNKRNYGGEVKYDRKEDWFIIIWKKMDIELAKRIRRAFRLDDQDVLFCGGGQKVVIEEWE